MQTVEISVRLLHRILEMERTLVLISDEMEDFLSAHEPAFLKKMRSAHREHRAGKTRSLQEFLAAYRKSMGRLYTNGRRDYLCRIKLQLDNLTQASRRASWSKSK